MGSDVLKEYPFSLRYTSLTSYSKGGRGESKHCTTVLGNAGDLCPSGHHVDVAL